MSQGLVESLGAMRDFMVEQAILRIDEWHAQGMRLLEAFIGNSDIFVPASPQTPASEMAVAIKDDEIISPQAKPKPTSGQKDLRFLVRRIVQCLPPGEFTTKQLRDAVAPHLEGYSSDWPNYLSKMLAKMAAGGDSIELVGPHRGCVPAKYRKLQEREK